MENVIIQFLAFVGTFAVGFFVGNQYLLYKIIREGDE